MTQRSLALIALALTAACSGGDKRPTTPTGSITVAVAPASASVTQGQTGTFAVALGRSNYAGSVELSAEGLPVGVTASFSPATVAPGGSASSLTLTAVAAATAGPATIVVRARGAGVGDATSTVALIVVALPPSIALTAPAAPVSVDQGATSPAANLTIRRVNYPTPVTISVSGLPVGVTATVASPTTDTSAALTFTAVATAPPTTATVTVTASGTGVTSSTATLSLRVISVPVSAIICTTSNVLWVAVQEATGPWRVVPRAANGRYEFTFDAPYGGFAYVWGSTTSDSRTMTLSYLSLSEMKALTATTCPSAGASKTVNVAIAPRAAGEAAAISYGTAGYRPIGSSSTGYTATGIPTGPHNLVAAKYGATLASKRLIIRRALEVPDNGTIAVDFNAAEATPLPSYSATVSGVPGGYTLEVGSFLYTLSAIQTSTYLGPGVAAGANVWNWAGQPASLFATGDLNAVYAQATAADGSYTSVQTHLTTPRNVLLSLGAPLTISQFGVASTAPYVRPRVAFIKPSDYNGSADFIMQQSNSALTRSLFVRWSQAYFGGSTPVDFLMPDFTGLAGWDSQFGLKTGVLAVMQLILSDGAVRVDGATYRAAGRADIITP